MRPPVIFTPVAREELIDAQDWYENKVPGLGRRFRAAVDDLIQRIMANPHQFPVIDKNIHRALFRRFPYALMFVIDPNDGVIVIACFHGSRNPMQWRRRA
ncbi:MAG TPA: type II toxin-antitoxin system RelE/ParE family toxin [Acidobacteriaceae bacterium]|nr:type II toxin-antitoxin system RelE/ParE family toxin [Acidobacteriaceae bacterium]